MFEWDPFEEFDRIEKRMRESFKKLFSEVEDEFSTVQGMPMHVKDENNELVIKAELPGFEKQDIGVRLTENSVEIAAHKKEQRQEQSEKMFKLEKKMNAVRRAITLPEMIDSKNAKVDFDKGVLTIRAPKKTARKIKEEVRTK